MMPYKNEIKDIQDICKKHLAKLREEKYQLKRRKASPFELDSLRITFQLFNSLNSSCVDAFKIEYIKKNPRRIIAKLFSINNKIRKLEIYNIPLIYINLEEDYPELYLGI
jgi:hypothetical protein